MPLTAFQKDVLAVRAANRSEESHFAGGVLLHASDDSPRFSRDFDILHDVALEVVRASERDVASLREAGFTVDTISRHGEWQRDTTFRRAIVRGPDGALVEVDWAADFAFRFFPIERDAQLGWRLHLFDAATNKALTLSRSWRARVKSCSGSRSALPVRRQARGCGIPRRSARAGTLPPPWRVRMTGAGD